MSDESQFNNPTSERALRTEESALLRTLLSGIYSEAELEGTLATCRVANMSDGGMGSIRFIGLGPRHFGKALVEAQYSDSDGVLVSIAVNADREGKLFELDFWKVDFSPLRRYPKPSELSKISPGQ